MNNALTSKVSPLWTYFHWFSCILTLHMLIGKDWSSSSWDEAVNARRTTHNDGRHPIARGKLSDLKCLELKYLWFYVEKIYSLSVGKLIKLSEYSRRKDMVEFHSKDKTTLKKLDLIHWFDMYTIFFSIFFQIIS